MPEVGTNFSQYRRAGPDLTTQVVKGMLSGMVCRGGVGGGKHRYWVSLGDRAVLHQRV